jgi:hypothetical protein
VSPPIFVHVPKTAGSTLRTVISENYKPDQILSLHGDPKEVLVSCAARIGKADSYHFIQGHIPYGVHRFLNVGGERYFTFLRDPVTRFLSEIAHVVRHSDVSFHSVLADPSLSKNEVISRALDICYFRNTMVHFISGTFSTEAISLNQLGSAIDNLWKFEFVGVAEEFELSLLVMGKKLGWRHLVPQRCNVRPEGAEFIDPELKVRLDRALAYDRMLYVIAQEHLDISKRKYGVLLEDAACELSELIKLQEAEYPDAKFIAKWGVTQVPLGSYNSRIKAGTSLHRWINE